MTLDLAPIKRRLAESDVVNPGADTQRVELSAEMLIHAPLDLAALVAEVERLRGERFRIINQLAGVVEIVEDADPEDQIESIRGRLLAVARRALVPPPPRPIAD